MQAFFVISTFVMLGLSLALKRRLAARLERAQEMRLIKIQRDEMNDGQNI